MVASRKLGAVCFSGGFAPLLVVLNFITGWGLAGFSIVISQAQCSPPLHLVDEEPGAQRYQVTCTCAHTHSQNEGGLGRELHSDS